MDKNVKRNNVLFLCDYQAIYGGNFVPSLVTLDNALVKCGYGVVYVFPREAAERPWLQELKSQGKTVETISFKSGKTSVLNCISELVERYAVGIVHTHFASVVVALRFSAQNPHVKVFFHIHSDFSAGRNSLKTKLYDWLVYCLCAGRVRFLSVSNAYVSMNPKKVTWVPNGLADRLFVSEHTPGAQLRERWKIQEGEILCEVFGWSPFVKGVDIAVDAVAELRKAGAKIKLAIICGREMIPEKMREWVKENTTCTGEESFLLYLEPIEDVFSYHEAADILLSTSRSEGFSYAILEMLSLGKKCVISDIPGVVWAKEFNSVYPFRNADASACAETIIKACNAPGWDSEEIRKQVLKKYSIQRWVNTILNEYGVEESCN